MLSQLLPTEKQIIFRPIQTKQQRRILQTLKAAITARLEEYSFANNCLINWNTFGSDIMGYYEFIIMYFSPHCDLTVRQITRHIAELICDEVKNLSLADVNQYNKVISRQLLFPGLVDSSNRSLEETEFEQLKVDIFEYLNSEYDSEFEYKNETLPRAVKIENSRKEVKEGSPVFIGYGFQIKKRITITQYLCIKIFEKILGENESSSAYFKLRDQGSIYTAITQFFFEQQYFVTGIFTTYDSLKAQTIEKMDFAQEITLKKLTVGKRLLLNEVMFAYATSEYSFYSMTFNIVNSSGLSVDELISKIKLIEVKDMQFLLKELKSLCFEVIQ